MDFQSTDPFVLSMLSSLPLELAYKVLEHLLEDTTLTLDFWDVTARYTPSPEIQLFPQPLHAEVAHLLRQRWLRTEKSFDNLWDYCLANILLFAQRQEVAIPSNLARYAEHASALSPAMRLHRGLSLHGMERIRLNLGSLDYFSLFEVHVPPFADELLRRSTPQGLHAAIFLKYTKELTLHFGPLYRAAHPWYELAETLWDYPGADGIVEARFRPNTCTAGLIVDWVLTFAWHHKLIQHIPIIHITGDVQPWVVEKWTQVFAGKHTHQEWIGGPQDIHDITHRGETTSNALGDEWFPQDHYPPQCECKIPCDRLQDGRVLPPIFPGEQGWDSEESTQNYGPPMWRKIWEEPVCEW